MIRGANRTLFLFQFLSDFNLGGIALIKKKQLWSSSQNNTLLFHVMNLSVTSPLKVGNKLGTLFGENLEVP